METKATDNVLPDALQLAANAARSLVGCGIQVLASYANGRRPVLIIDKPPRFVRGAVKRRQPNGRGGITLACAASYQGCQIEWLQDVPSWQEVGHA